MKHTANLVRRFLAMKKTGWGILGAVAAFTGYAYWSTKHLTVTNYNCI